MNTKAPQLKHYANNKQVVEQFQPQLHTKRYQIDLQRFEGVAVIRVRYLKSKRADWYFRVHQQDVRIPLLTLNNKQQLVVLDSEGNLTLYDCKLQVCIGHMAFLHRYDFEVQANDDYLYIYHDNNDKRENTLIQIDYHKFVIKRSVDIDSGFESISNTMTVKNRFSRWSNNNYLYLRCPDYAHGKEDLAGLLTG